MNIFSKVFQQIFGVTIYHRIVVWTRRQFKLSPKCGTQNTNKSCHDSHSSEKVLPRILPHFCPTSLALAHERHVNRTHFLQKDSTCLRMPNPTIQ
jgi:hypothetical protein